MKKIFAIGALVMGTFAFAQAQTATPQDAPKRNGNQIKEAPAPSGNPSATGSRTTAPSTTGTGTAPQNNTLEQPGTAPRTTAPGDRVIINGTAPVQVQPVKKVDATPAPKN